MFYTFRLTISPNDVLKFYEGHMNAVSVVTDQGLRLQFPFHHLKPFVSLMGVSGNFRVTLSASNKLLRIERIS
jgi:hypothetical protein